MRLTAELIQGSLSYLNPLKERELDLRGQRISAIENLAVADPHDAIDFTDNDIEVLGNFPLSPRLNTLLVGRNKIHIIQTGMPTSVPNLKNLVLASNSLAELADLDVLGKFLRLKQLVLTDNPVTKKQYYRYWVVWCCPSVRFLDHEKVRQAEREKSRELFGTADQPKALASEIMNKKSTFLLPTANGSSASSKLSRIKLTEEEKSRLRERIVMASSLAEVMALEKELEEGRLPTGVHQDSMEQ